MVTEQTPPDSICILRLSAIGDVTHVIPVINAIKSQWPNIKITWICGALEYKLLSCLPGVRFIVFKKHAGLKSYLDVHKQLGGERFDILLHMHASARANMLSVFIRARTKLGWDDDNARDLHRLFIDKKISAVKARHQVQGYLEFARTIGIEIDQPVWDFPVPPEAMEFARHYLPDASRVLLISPCSSHDLRNWKAEQYAAVADFAIEKMGMTVVLSGGPGELDSAMGKAIDNVMVNKSINLIGKDTLLQLSAMLKCADVVISPDSGPIHIANAVGTKAIGLYACTKSRRSGPYNSLDLCVDKYDEAARVFLNKDADTLAWNNKIELDGVMDLIKVDEVTDKLDQCFK